MVSNYGRVKRVGNYRNQNKSWSSEDKILSAGNNGRGYLFVNLSMNNKTYHRYIHRLVAEAFIPNPLNKKTVIVPFHSKDLGKGLEQAILKQAGLK